MLTLAWLQGSALAPVPGRCHPHIMSSVQPRCTRCQMLIGAPPSIPAPGEASSTRDRFHGCRICGALACASCAADTGERCRECSEQMIANEYPPVWVNGWSVWASGWCMASPPGELHVRPTGRAAPWWACLVCAAEYCDPCARSRGERCRCLARIVLGADPPARAFLPPDLRRLVSEPRRSRSDKEALLRAAISRIDTDWERGVINDLEWRRREVYVAALRELNDGLDRVAERERVPEGPGYPPRGAPHE